LDDWVGTFVLAVLLGLAGWVLGIVGFFRAGRALSELEALRRQVLPAATRSVEGPAPQAAAAPAPAPAAPMTAEPAAMPVLPPPAPVQPPSKPMPPPTRHPDFEALLTMRWGVWLGAGALLLAGVFLIRYAVDQGFLGPAMRVAAAAVLGAALISAGQWAKRDSRAVRGPLARDQVPGALAAGGVAMLFSAAYGAGPFYGLVPPSLAFVLMGAAGLSGLALSLSEGSLVAAVGLAGAFATPALVHADRPDLPGLFAYLAVVTAAALLVVRYTAWIWLGWTATVAAAIWVMIAAGIQDASTVWAPALFVPVAAALNLLLLHPAALEGAAGRRLAWIPILVLGIAGLLLADSIDDSWPRAGLLLIAPTAVWIGWRRPALDRLPWLAAGFALCMLAIWPLPAVQPTGEAITIEGRIQAVLPGAFAPEAIRPYLWVSALVAGVFAACGLWLERRAARPPVWSALVAAVPVLVLALGFYQVRKFQPDMNWAFAGLGLAGILVGTAWASAREDDRRRAGVHGAGAVAALALGCAMLLTDQWLTLAIALILPGLAWIEAATDLPALRRVASAVASLVLVRLLLNWYVADYVFGAFPIVNGLVIAYFLPALCFAAAALRFRRRGGDLTVAILFGGAAALGTVFVMAEIHHWATGGTLARDRLAFFEQALHVSALGVLALGTMIANRRVRAPVLRWAWMTQGALGMLGAVLLLPSNPVATGDAVGHLPLVNALLGAYLAPAALATLALRQSEIEGGWRQVLAAYALAAILAWVTLEVRHWFHPIHMDRGDAGDAEIWAYSGAWLVYGLALTALGINRDRKVLRLVALAVVGLTATKAVLFDIGGIGGLWRVLSFLILGLVLIGLGAVYRRFVARPPGDAVSPASEPEV
jgi:uncharacterized membrane protein